MKLNTALILCAGFGKRLNPLTLETPKPLLKVNNITLLDRTIHLIKELGIEKIIINTFHLKDKIKKYIEENKFNIEIKIIEDGEQILNTGGGVFNMIKCTKEENFLIFNPDTIWNLEYLDTIKSMIKFYITNDVQNILMVVRKDLSFDKSLKGDFTLLNNKLQKNNSKTHIYTGCQIINRECFLEIEEQNFSFSRIWNKLRKRNVLFGFESHNKFYHLTNFEIYQKLLKSN